MPTTELRMEEFALPAAKLGPENPLPAFRDRKENREYATGPDVPPEDARYLGWQTGFRVLPYRMQDAYTGVAGTRVFKAAVLENALLRAVFLPALGGRLMSLVHKPMGRELVDRNPVLKFANVALRNAWFSGGVEWNLGLLGHHFLTCSPVFAERLRGPGGEPVLRLHEWDRLKGLAWQIDFHLPEESPFLFARVRVVNPTPRDAAMYWWTNIAVPEAPDVRTLAPAERVFFQGGAGLDLRQLPEVDGTDVTRPTAAKSAMEIFFRIPDGQRPWIASLDGRGRGLVHTSTSRLRGRKMFVWGMNPGGRRWQEYLSVPGRAYLEIQAGLARTQMESLPMPAGDAWEWTEAFGPLEADPRIVHGNDWDAAWRCADAALEAALPRKAVEKRHEDFASVRDNPPEELLSAGSGWGALERRRLRDCREPDRMPPGLVFPDSTLGPDQAPWLSLLTGALPERDPREEPGAWMIQPEWEQLLQAAVETGRSRHWLGFLHLGVMRAERFDFAGAREAFARSVEYAPSCWALRNLAQIDKGDGNLPGAADLIVRAWDLTPPRSAARHALARECVEALAAAGKESEAIEFIKSLPPEISAHERIGMAHARIALKRGDLDEVESILRREFIGVREGEMELTDIWFGMWDKRVSAAEGVPIDEALRQRVRRDHPPPSHIDFRNAQG